MPSAEKTALHRLPAADVATIEPAASADIAGWVRQHALSPSDVDCATAVMLKILDGKCKMSAIEKLVMERLYDAVKGRPGWRLDADCHALIGAARGDASEALKNFIYEKRLLAETTISRPVMKAFKAMIRREGLFAGLPDDEDNASA